MEEDDDDFYGGGGPRLQDDDDFIKSEGYGARETRMDLSEDQDDDEEDSDDDVQFTLEKPPDATPQETAAKPRTTRQQAALQEQRASSEVKEATTGPAIKQEVRSGSTGPAIAVRSALTYDGKEGKDFPEIRTSRVDVNDTPVWPANGKPITEVDLDADLAENSKLWRLPGTDQTDFFNYGLDEYTWAQYCLRQQTMSNTIADQKQQDAEMKAMFGGGTNGNGSNSVMPPGMPPMPGMPSPEEFFQQMMSSGMNPGDPNQFMQMMMSGGMPGMPNAPQGLQNQQQQQGGGNFGQQGGGFGGQSQNTASPHPPSGQGFQPPQGPALQQGQQGDQGGFSANMEGYSPQQIAIMQQQGGMGGQGGAGGGRRGARRGRGYY